ncbi:MAG: hypothetical protein O7G85_14515, partial [Planctomycetota bacterium]|nr:hypothetical protein [Planctomycetota bacterium]
RMDVSYHADTAHSTIYIDGRTLAGEIVVRIFTALVSREFGPDEFTVRRVGTNTAHSAAVAA